MERVVRGGGGADEFLSLTCSHALFIQSCDVGAGLYEIFTSDHRFGLLVEMKNVECRAPFNGTGGEHLHLIASGHDESFAWAE